MIWRWLALHVGAGLAGAGAAYGALRGIEAGDTMAGLLAYLAALLLLTAGPVAVYQAAALRRGIQPRRWILVTLVPLLPAPVLLLLGMSAFLWLMPGSSGPDQEAQVMLAWVLSGFAVGLFWAAPLQWLALRQAVPFWLWWRHAGPSLGVAGATVVAVFLCALIFQLAWISLLPLAALAYALGTYPVLRPLLDPDGPARPALPG